MKARKSVAARAKAVVSRPVSARRPAAKTTPPRQTASQQIRSEEIKATGIRNVALLKTLTSIKGGDFDARVPVDQTGIPGRIAGALNAILDVNEKMCGELARIRETVEKLEQRVVQCAEERVECDEALRLSNEDLNQFAYAASHDLQEPLRMVALFSQMLLSSYAGRLDADADQYIGYVVNGAQRMELLLRDLLAYSQAGSALEGPMQQVDCGVVMECVTQDLAVSIEESGASVTWSGLPVVAAHEGRMIQLFKSLVENGIKYRGLESPRIRVSARRAGTGWIFSVEDNGIGIDPEYAHQIFGVFKRLHGRNYPGTGIGLAICQRIAERYGGRIWVESAQGGGSSFCFSMPAPEPERSLKSRHAAWIS
jgi:light-regulated signal transduction histidine kinase (bacteriophytochrome)